MKQQRLTRQKQLVLKIAQAHHDHPTADQIFCEVRETDQHISRGTVYRNLKLLAQAGQLLHIKLPQADRFDAHLALHYHLVCLTCGAVIDAPLPYLAELDEQIGAQTGFRVDRHRALFEGWCSACQAAVDQKEQPSKANQSFELNVLD